MIKDQVNVMKFISSVREEEYEMRLYLRPVCEMYILIDEYKQELEMSTTWRKPRSATTSTGFSTCCWPRPTNASM